MRAFGELGIGDCDRRQLLARQIGSLFGEVYWLSKWIIFRRSGNNASMRVTVIGFSMIVWTRRVIAAIAGAKCCLWSVAIVTASTGTASSKDLTS